jgi:hypothetical protein
MTRLFRVADLDRAEGYLAGQEVSSRWQDAMAEFLEGTSRTRGRRRSRKSFASTDRCGAGERAHCRQGTPRCAQ